MNEDTPIILGSGSVFRRDLLASTGLKFEVFVADCDEKVILGTSPLQTAQLRAQAKAKAVSVLNKGSIVIGCDQVLSFNGKHQDKVKTAEEAEERLFALQGKTHILHSAYSLVLDNQEVLARVVDIKMTMKPLTIEEIRLYVSTNEWQGCVGCYQFENKGGALFSEVDGTEDAIIGLPLKELKKDLQSLSQ